MISDTVTGLVAAQQAAWNASSAHAVANKPMQPSQMGDLFEKLAQAMMTAHSVELRIKATADRVLGARPDTALANEGPRAVANGHVDRLQTHLVDLSGFLDRCSELLSKLEGAI